MLHKVAKMKEEVDVELRAIWTAQSVTKERV